MPVWTAGFAAIIEISRNTINDVLDKLIKSFGPQLQYTRGLGRIGRIEAEIQDFNLLEMEDLDVLDQIPVQSDLQLTGRFRLFLFSIRFINTGIDLALEDIGVELTKTPAGLPRGVVVTITPTFSAKLTFPGSRFIAGWLLNTLIGPLISFGIWVAFRIIRRVEIPIWEMVDVFAALGLRYAPDSPVLTAYKTQNPDDNSLLLAADLTLTNKKISGDITKITNFLPPGTGAGAAMHEKVLSAAIDYAMVKGWIPTYYQFGGWKIYLNSINAWFEPDKIRASGHLKAKRGSCWCRVKVQIQFNASVVPTIDPATAQLDFTYDADVNVHISTSGMLVILGVIMFAPVFFAVSLCLAQLTNMVLDKLLPFRLEWKQAGLQVTIDAKPVNAAGFVPLSMHFPLQIFGSGSFDLSRFTTFQLPNNGPQLQVNFTQDSLAINDEELRMAVELK